MSFHQYGALNHSKTIININDDDYKLLVPINVSQENFINIINYFKNIGCPTKYITLFKEDGSFLNTNSDIKMVREINMIKSNFSISDFLTKNNYFIGAVTISGGEECSITVSNSGKVQLRGENDLVIDVLLECLK